MNAALAVAGTSVFVGSYAGLQERAILRRLAGGKWSTLLDSEHFDAVRQLWSTDRDLYFHASDRILHMDLQSLESEPIEVKGSVVWSAAPDDIVVCDQGVIHLYDGQGWHDQPVALGKPVAVTGHAHGELYVLDADGVIAQAQGESFLRLAEQPPLEVNDISTAGGALLAVAGDDQGGGKTGPGAIMRYTAGHWEMLQAAPRDALLGIASAGPERIYAVGATRRDDAAHPVVWRFAAGKWTRLEIETVDAFLWDVACDANGTCYAAGTDNTFVNLSDLE